MVEWREPGQVSHGSSSHQVLLVLVVSALNTHLQLMKTQTYRCTMDALNMPTHALLSTSNRARTCWWPLLLCETQENARTFFSVKMKTTDNTITGKVR